MAPTFNSTGSKVTVTASVPARTEDGYAITEWSIRNALADVARDNRVPLGDLSVSLEPGEESVTLTRAEYDALRSQGAGS